MPDPFDLSRLLKAAQAAPSILNTQPWLFRPVADDLIQLCADPGPDPNYPEGREMHLKVTDTRAREMIISCGAALFNLLLAIRVTGHYPVINVVQGQDVADLIQGRKMDPDPVLLATVNIGINKYRATTIMEQHLYDAIQLRHTIREPFGPPKLKMNLVTQLQLAGRKEEGVNARLLRKRESRRFVDWAADVNRRLKENEPYVAELKEWTGSNAIGGRGVPTDAFGPLPEDEDYSPIRDLGLAWGRRKQARFDEKNARLIVLTTESDTTADWMHVGQALQRLLLTATHFGVQASFISQPFEDLDWGSMKQPGTLWPWPRPWHIVIRLGYTSERHETPHANPRFEDMRTAQTPSISGGISRDVPSS
jgi:hypothetical protein